MAPRSRSNQSSGQRALEQRRAASALGAAAVSREFSALITRKRFCELVGIHPTTLKRWEREKLVTSKMREVIGIKTATFRDEDIAVARDAVRLLRDDFGKITSREAFLRARQARS